MSKGRAPGGIPEGEGVTRGEGQRRAGEGQEEAKKARGEHEEGARCAKICGKPTKRRGDGSESEGGQSAGLTRVKREEEPEKGEPPCQKWVEDGRNVARATRQRDERAAGSRQARRPPLQ